MCVSLFVSSLIFYGEKRLIGACGTDILRDRGSGEPQSTRNDHDTSYGRHVPRSARWASSLSFPCLHPTDPTPPSPHKEIHTSSKTSASATPRFSLHRRGKSCWMRMRIWSMVLTMQRGRGRGDGRVVLVQILGG